MIKIDSVRYSLYENAYFDAVYDNLKRMKPENTDSGRFGELEEIQKSPRAIRMLVFELSVFGILPDKYPVVSEARKMDEWDEKELESAVRWLLLADYRTQKKCVEKIHAVECRYKVLLKAADKTLNDVIFINRIEAGHEFLDYFQKNAYKTLRSTEIPDLWERASLDDRITVPEAVAQAADLRVCPYCGRSFIGIKRDKEKPVNLGLQLDHFFSRDRFPHFAISLYNLIPCCGICNLIKGAEYEPELISPLDEENDFDKKVTFRFDFDQLPGIGELRKVRILVDEKEPDSSRYNKNIKFFHLDEAYGFHRDEAAAMCGKIMSYPKSLVEEIAVMMYGEAKDSSGENDISASARQKSDLEFDLERMIFEEAFSELSDFRKKPLAKLYRDLYMNYRE